MKKIMIGFSLIIISSLCALVCVAETQDFSPTSWSSKSTDDTVTIQNGNAVPIIVEITVNGGGAGINLQNCGNTSHVNAGSSAICSNSDSTSPINFSSDTTDKKTSGTYLIKLKPQL